METNSNTKSDYIKILIKRGAPLKKTTKLPIKYTDSNFQSNSFDAELRDTNISFQTLKMKDSILLWIGKASQPDFADLSLAMKSKIDQDFTVAKIIGPTLEMTSQNLANRLSKKLQKQVFVSCNVNIDSISLPYIEKCIMEEFKQNNELL